MNIWMLIPDYFPIVGGAEKQCHILSKELLKHNHNINIITRLPNKLLHSNKRNILEHEGIKITRIRIHKIFEFAILSWFFYLLKNINNYQILHLHTLHESFLPALILSLIFKKPLLLKLTGSGSSSDLKIIMQFVRNPLKLIIIKSIKYSSSVICITKSIQKELLNIGVPNSKLTYIPNGVVIPDIKFNKNDAYVHSKESLRHKYNIPLNKFVVIRIGNYHDVKGVKYFIQAIKKLSNYNNQITALSVGDINTSKQLNITKILNIDNLKFIPFISNIHEIYQLADLLVVPSLGEGLSNVILESLSFGVPVIATTVGGNNDVITNGYNGYLIPPRDSFSICNSILKLYHNKELLNKMSTNALKSSLKYNIKLITSQYNDLYYNLLK